MNRYARGRHTGPLFLIATGLMLLALVACNGSGGGDASPSGNASPTSEASPTAAGPGATANPDATASPEDAATPTPHAEDTPEGEILAASVLLDDDLPDGMITAASSYSRNEQLVEGEEDTAAKLDELSQWGRLLGYEVNFVAGADAPDSLDVVAITSTASLYSSAEGAGQSYDSDVQAARDADWAASYPAMTDLEVEQLERPDLADAAFWLRVTAFQPAGGGGQSLYVEDFVVFRHDTLRGFVRQVAVVDPAEGRDALREEVAALVERQVENMTAALEVA